ncbi:hypothetical protein ABPG74_018942 [Tetrahymena malaccensis]
MCFGSSSKKQPSKPKLLKPKQSQFKTKLILLGDMNVGKTSICEYYKKNVPAKNMPNTIGVTYFEFDIKLENGINVHLDIWDTAGQEIYQSLLKMYYQDANIVFLVFDVGARQTLERVEYWISELKEQVDDNNLKLILIGNKCDIDADKRQISLEQGQDFARNKNIPYFETSAMTGEGIVEVFRQTVKDYVQYKTSGGK